MLKQKANITLSGFTPLWLSRFTTVVVLSTVFLLAAGASVTSTGSGLAVPDWPLSFGKFFPEMKGGVFYEHGHRLVAGAVALLTCLQGFLYFKYESRRTTRILSGVAIALVLTQAALGGLTVLLKLPPEVSISHACLAQIFFCTNVLLLLSTRESLWLQQWVREPISSLEVSFAACLSILFFIQLILGATTRHLGAGLAISDFPTVFGGFVPPYFNVPILVHFLHRLGAYTLTVSCFGYVSFLFKRHTFSPRLLVWAGSLLALITIQILLGAGVIWSKKMVILTVAHLVTGSLCLALSLALFTALWRQRALQMKVNYAS